MGLLNLGLVWLEESGHQCLLGLFGSLAVPIGFVPFLFGEGIKQQVVPVLLTVLGGPWGSRGGGEPFCD